MQEGPSGRGKRFVKLATMTASVAGSYAKTRLKTLFLSDEQAERALRLAHLRSGERIAHTLGELRGAVMKVGQMASSATSLLPKELVDALRGLQRQAQPMAYETVARQIEAAMGRPPEEIFRFFDPTPFAGASIGQVHRAETRDGRQVVCKVQYPGVETAVDSDLGHLRLALRAGGFTKVNRQALEEAFEELRVRLNEELDYCHEAESLDRLRDYHAEHHPFVCIPEVVEECSCERVLTLTYEPGDALHTLAAQGYAREQIDLFGERLVIFLLDEIFHLGMVHGDPHPGNFAFRRDGTVVLYDFGCTKALPPQILSAYCDLINSGLQEDYDRVEGALLRLGVRNEAGPPVERGYYKAWRDLLAEIFLRSEVMDFSVSAGLRDRLTRELPGVMKRLGSFQPAKDLIVLNRVILGHYANLRSLGARVPVVPMLLQRVSGSVGSSR